MDAHTLMNRVKELEQAIEQSAANHNGLVGRLLEAKELLATISEPLCEGAANVIDVDTVNTDTIAA